MPDHIELTGFYLIPGKIVVYFITFVLALPSHRFRNQVLVKTHQPESVRTPFLQPHQMKYSEPDHFETHHQSLRFYNALGLPVLKKAIMATIGKFVLQVNPREKMPSYFIGHPFSVESMNLTIKWLYFNEIVHSGLIVVCAALGQFFWTKGYSGGVVFMALSILLNMALALMQRMNRIRIKRTMEALKKRKH
ncbi:MAG: hypothetical protein FD170_783 [Bacteroidetes bacterium]|nr:MAG: hypothetical protein FD170_783 [Bacteroidota bacterium]